MASFNVTLGVRYLVYLVLGPSSQTTCFCYVVIGVRYYFRQYTSQFRWNTYYSNEPENFFNWIADYAWYRFGCSRISSLCFRYWFEVADIFYLPRPPWRVFVSGVCSTYCIPILEVLHGLRRRFDVVVHIYNFQLPGKFPFFSQRFLITACQACVHSLFGKFQFKSCSKKILLNVLIVAFLARRWKCLDT